MLEEHLKKLEEAKLRDHNKLGRELEYFTTVDYVGQGLPILLPKGARVVQLLQRWVEDVEQSKGCLLTKTPLLAKRDLYKISGHWDHYLDGMFVLGDPHDEEKECFALRPMTCPFQYQVYLNKQRSYRDLPMRLTETSTLFRNEASGEMHGLIRVRQFTISEGHYILRPDQLEQEFKGCLELAKYFLDTVGLLENCTFRFSQWDPENKNNKYEGTKEQWEESQAVMKTILDDLDVDYEIGIDEAAFYGPKLDIQYKNVFGKEDTIVTIQIDMLLAERFGMYYIDKDGQKKLPYIIHRTSLGCFERTLAYKIERFAGVMPLWLAPEQIRLLPIKEGNVEYAQGIADRLTSLGMRVTVDSRDENIGPKIKAARLERIPYILVIGDNEMNSSTVTVRSRKRGEIPNMSVDEFVALVIEERTGRILPVSNPRRRYIALACIGVILVAAIAFGIFSILKSSQKSNPETPEQIQAESEMLLTVVDSANPLDKDYVPDLETVNGFRVNRDALNPLENLLKASKENGTELKIKTAYVSYDEQEERFQSELQKMLQSSKYTTVRAEAEVLKTTPHGGQSELQTGLLVEFDFSNSGSKAFLERNCVEYGFVQRYTESKTSVTRMNPSDSLYRYVGIENAKRMRSYGMCLEEYKSYLQKQAIPK